MLAVAFFRNLNLGQPRSPRRADLVSAFEEVGARQVSSYRSNGTVIFESPAPKATAARVVARLAESCGYADVAVVRRRRWLCDQADTWAAAGDGAEVTLFDSPRDFPESLPWSPNPKVSVIAADRQHALCLNHEPRTSFGTPVIERLLGVRATSRSTGTMLGVLDRLS